MFYLIGLGLGDAKDITVKGLEIVKAAKRVYLEAYTSILTVGKDALVSDQVTVCFLDNQIIYSLSIYLLILSRSISDHKHSSDIVLKRTDRFHIHYMLSSLTVFTHFF